MNLKEAEQCIKDVWGADTKIFAREDFISGNKKVLRPLAEGEDPMPGRTLHGEKLVILGQGKTWEDALRAPVTEEMTRRRAAAARRAAIAAHEGEMFAIFLREKHAAEFEQWRLSSPLAQQQDAGFNEDLKKADAGQLEAPKDSPRA